MKTCVFLLLLICMVVYAVATPSKDGWRQIEDANASDSEMHDLGVWAVNHHNRKTNDHLEFQKVVSAREQVSPKGFYHELVINAVDRAHKSDNYKVSVLIVDSVDKTEITLLSFNTK
ncbi:hypothetical protein QOZ80_4AG0326300 [Eleusine coracana subsp. coracana]|nr:hypothetical protein QOZ80_4AG0326300 [Eleusine coracana subsp. coracana]